MAIVLYLLYTLLPLLMVVGVAGSSPSYVVTNFYGFENNTNCNASVPQARYFGRLNFCSYNSYEYRRELKAKAPNALAPKTSSEMKTKAKTTVKNLKDFLLKKTSTGSMSFSAKSVEKRTQELAESKKEGKKDVQAYSSTADKRTVTAYPVGVDGIQVTQTVFYVDENDTKSFLCDAAHYSYTEESYYFPFEQCFDYRDPEGQYRYGDDVGFAKISIESSVSFPADGISVTLFTKDQAGQTSCANNLLADGQNDDMRPAFGVAWYPTGTCIGYSPFTNEMDDDNYQVNTIKYTCNGNGTITVDFWDKTVDLDGVGPTTCEGTPTETFTIGTGSSGCTNEDIVDDDDAPLDKLYPDDGTFDENAWMRIDCVQKMSPKGVKKGKVAKKVDVKKAKA